MDFNILLTRKINAFAWKVSLGFVLYITSNYIQNYTYNLLFILASYSLLGLVLFDTLSYYFFMAKKNFERKRAKYLSGIALVLIIIASLVLYSLIGLGPGFYIAVFGGIVGYIFMVVSIFATPKKKT